MRERRLVTDFGAYSTPREFLIISISPPNTRLWEYLVPPIITLLTIDGSILHILRIYTTSNPHPTSLNTYNPSQRISNPPIPSWKSPLINPCKIIHLINPNRITSPSKSRFNEYFIKSSRGYTELSSCFFAPVGTPWVDQCRECSKGCWVLYGVSIGGGGGWSYV